MARKYPQIGSVRQRKKNVSAKCKCGEVAKFWVDIQFTYMRGDDDVVWACESHKQDLDYLLSGAYT